MAKAGFWLRGARGKLAGASLQKGEGGTIMREIVTPTNPKTLGQAIQRLAFSTAVRVAKALEMIVDHSFEGVKYGAASVRHFTKMAVPVIKQAILNPQIVDGVKLVPALPMGYLTSNKTPMQIAEFPISMGSLQGLNFGFNYMHPGDPMPWRDCALAIDGFMNINADFTIENLKAAGVDTGAQITILFCNGENGVTDSKGVNFNGAWNWAIARINFKKDVSLDTKLYTATEATGEFKLNTAALDLESCTNATQLVFIADKGCVYVDSGCAAAAVIVSKYENGEWRRSTSYLKNNIAFEDATAELIGHTSGYNNLDDLIQAYLAGSSSEGDRYLNREVNSDIQYNPAEEEEEEEEPEP